MSSYSNSIRSAVGTGNAGQILQSNGIVSNFSWTASTYPSTVSVSTLLYASSANVVSALATANNAILNTNGSGVPSLSTSPSISGTYTTTAGNLAFPVTTSSAGQITVAATRVLHFYAGGDTGTLSSTFLGGGSGNFTFTQLRNTGLGWLTLGTLTSGTSNTAVGAVSGGVVTSGQHNALVGQQSGGGLTTGSFNSGLGSGTFCPASAPFLSTGSYNVAVGYAAGSNYTTSESSNILILNPGVVSESNVIRIGATGSGNAQQNACFIAGIHGATVTGAAVLISTSGQLGDISSSIKVKENVQSLDAQSILALRAVKFNYISDQSKSTCYGMIAEEVEKVFPDLVLYKEGNPYSIKYHELPALLLSEIQKLDKRIKQLESRK